MSTLKSVAITGNKCIRPLNSVEVGTTLSNFNIPPLIGLMSLNRRGAEYHCYCDGEIVSNVEKDFISRMNGIVVQWGKEQGVMIDGE